MLDQNIKRRHLTIGQKAMFAQAMFEHEQNLAKERQKASGGDKKSEDAKKSVQATLPEPKAKPQARDVVAKRVGVGQKAFWVLLLRC